MTQRMMIWAVLLFLATSVSLFAQDEGSVSAVSEAAEGLDLEAVSELFKDSEDLESFEQALNDPETGINNLDLDEDGQVDYIRVVEEVADETHVIILQVPLGEDEFQDVATIEIEKTDEESYNMQVHGNEDLYGTDYYVAPTVTHIHTWPIITHIYRPSYRPYRSTVVWDVYPRWWKPWKPVRVKVYHKRITPYRNRTTFVFTRTGRVGTVHKIKYTPRRSGLVKKKVIIRPATRRRATARPRKR